MNFFRRLQSGVKTLPPVHANIGTEAIYLRQLDGLVAAMAREVTTKILALYRRKPPVIAQDELPSEALKREVKAMARRWEKQFADAAPKLASYYAKSAERRSAKQLERTLREGGFSVRFKMTPTMRDVMNASVAEQVGLIKSIPEKYFADVEGILMRSVSVGRDLGTMATELQDRFGVTRKRAALISRDQNNKATATMTRVRHLEMGIKRAIWVHSHAGKEPRPSHLKNDGKEYDIETGWYDPDEGEHIFPGQLINCRCFPRPIVEGFS